MTKYYQDGTKFVPLSEKNLPLVDKLPVATYVLKFDKTGGYFYLDQIDNFILPPKLYGKTSAYTQRILTTATSREVSTGALLVGEKGSGKTLLAKKLALDAQDLGWPTVLINMPYSGDTFMSFIRGINTPCTLIFDEFEKVYGSLRSSDDDDDGPNPNNPPKQDSILTLLEGVYSSKNLIILTANDRYKISTYLKNRPGRLHYMIDFAGLDEEFILDYCTDNLINADHTQGIINQSYLFEHFNFDMLQALVEEMNRYGEDAQEAVKLLNIKAFEDSFGVSYNVVVLRGRDRVEIHRGHTTVDYNPLARGSFSIYCKCGSDPDGWAHAEFKARDLTSVDKSGKMAFRNSIGLVAELEKVQFKTLSYVTNPDIL